MAHIYNLRVDLEDARDFLYNLFDPEKALPESVDLRSRMPTVYDQGQLGSCSAQSVGAAIEFINESYQPSRLYIYYNERAEQGTVSIDSGSTLRVGIKTTVKNGACPETEWPYDISKFTVKPPDTCYTDSKKDLVTGYYGIAKDKNLIDNIRHAISTGFPVVYGMLIFSSFESEPVTMAGQVPMPDLKTEKFLGAHALLISGYDNSKKQFIIRNSWGDKWGDKGYFYLPYEYITLYATDFWVIQKV